MKDTYLIGKPNSGKSSLFNQLTGLHQKIGNYSGVTVNLKVGKMRNRTIFDLPGLQSIHTNSPEEDVSKDQILELDQKFGRVVFVANGMQLSESLLLFSEFADLCIPVIFVINFKDEIEKNKISIDIPKLQNRLACPVVVVNSKKGDGIEELRHKIEKDEFVVPNTFCRSHYDAFEGDAYSNGYRAFVSNGSNLESIESDHSNRWKVINGIERECIRETISNGQWALTRKWDKVLLNPFLGLPIFLVTLFIVFQAVFTFAAFPMDWIDQGVSFLAGWVEDHLPKGLITEFISEALIPGIGGVLIFVPQIAILFFLLGILEQTGYLSRISYISDAFLRKFGLSGHSVIPLMSSWACAIPAIMSARVIKDPRERLTVILASPLMTCSARLPVYVILIAVVFPADQGYHWSVQGLTMLALYLIGTFATLLVAVFVNKRLKVPTNRHWLLELPVYRTPIWRNVFHGVYTKTRSFVVQAGKIILIISLVLWFLAKYSPHDAVFINQKLTETRKLQSNEVTLQSIELEYSYLGYVGKIIEPVIRPLGYDWKIGIALAGSFAAREVFVSTLSTIYSIGSEDQKTIVQRLRSEKIAGTQEKRFDLATSVSLLLFYVFALQCMSTVAIVRKETGYWYYAIIQFILMGLMAYVVALIAFHLIRSL